MSLLSVTRRGDGRPFVWLHGFTQTRDSAQRFRTILAETFELWTLDLPGHGTASAVTASLDEAADLIVGVLPDEAIDLGGYSLGGRVALHVAIRHPERIGRLVLVSATRGIRDDAERAQRRRRDDALAEHILEVGTAAFLDEWLAQPLFSTLPDDPVERAARSRDAAGLAASLRTLGTGTQEWLGDRLAVTGLPTMAIAGALDAKFTAEAQAIADADASRAALVGGAGHATHLEEPQECAELVSGFLA
ncbi:MAG TPA: alpha/beta fold hydrolase [Acidimicrobiales bacterium]|nr:alpha/beta fold hydrolase [Acidimicrobiales bacterium]